MSELAHIFGGPLLFVALFALVLVLMLFGLFVWEMWRDSRALSAFEKQLLEEAKLPRLAVKQIMKNAVILRKGREE